VVVAVEKGYSVSAMHDHANRMFRRGLLSGFFLRNKKQVSRSSRYLVR